MYDQSTMARHTKDDYSHHPVQQSPKQYPTVHTTSSAFSASANPNEDWTKISDLSERRRIQNRIAQRNYRKKLKKRFEDLERRAGSSSASPEQRPRELAQPETVPSSQTFRLGHLRQRSSNTHLQRDRTPEELTQQYVLPSDDRGMFSQQYTRQISTSSPPFSYASIPSTEGISYPSYSQSSGYCNLPSVVMDKPLHPQYLPLNQHAPYPGVQGMATPPIKQEFCGDDELSPFNMSYASMSGVDVHAAQSYLDMSAFTPPLSASFKQSQAGSPPELMAYPHTPASMPRTPPMQAYDR